MCPGRRVGFTYAPHSSASKTSLWATKRFAKKGAGDDAVCVGSDGGAVVFSGGFGGGPDKASRAAGSVRGGQQAGGRCRIAAEIESPLLAWIDPVRRADAACRSQSAPFSHRLTWFELPFRQRCVPDQCLSIPPSPGTKRANGSQFARRNEMGDAFRKSGRLLRESYFGGARVRLQKPPEEAEIVFVPGSQEARAGQKRLFGEHPCGFLGARFVLGKRLAPHENRRG